MARKRFEFWLNDKRAEDWSLNELIAQLKKPAKGQGQFTRAIREGIRLWVSLRDGQIDVLLELFPWVREALTKPTLITPVHSGAGQLDEIKSMLELVVKQQSSSGYIIQSSSPTTPKPLPAPPVAEVKTAALVSADEIASNFLSMFN